MTTALFTHSREVVSLVDAAATFCSIPAAGTSTAILYSPHWCRLASVQSGLFCGCDGRPMDVGTVYEARIFNPAAELRWRNDPSARQCHRAVILMEQDGTARLGDSWRTLKKDCIEKLSQTYLLWGEGTGKRLESPAWSELATARIGALPVPIAGIGKNQNVLLESVEYLVEAVHGNVVVLDERLIAMKPAEDRPSR